ncbi:MAG: hypothetical protein M8357_01935 [Desulfobulbaceae bacterium]|nr:hypothetical protein [Desulfobulbaceae bacterium]
MKKECSACGGTGQIGFFQGVSRFLLSWDECPHCCGTGFMDNGERRSSARRKNEQEKDNRFGKKRRTE